MSRYLTRASHNRCADHVGEIISYIKGNCIVKERVFDSLQIKDIAVVDMPVDADAAAKRLAKAITFPTTSNQDRSDFDEKAFNDFHQYLVDTLPAYSQNPEMGDPR
ncbi:hypothetical protein ACSAZL_16970 [Methanosarcina sp. T3]|uniref:hypothetical protein n=1 Tax=Methanosarcina sp. T3 TaxID=3439062 RepID=UPI003F847492